MISLAKQLIWEHLAVRGVGRMALSIGLVMLCLCGLWPLPGNAQGEERLVKIGVYENAPKIFTSQNGTPAGIFIDIITHIAELERWQVTYVFGTWTEGLDRLENGEIDLMPDVAFSADRATRYRFHRVPALSSWYQVYAPKDSGIRTIFDLAGRRVLVLERSVQQAAFERLGQGFGLNTILIGVPDYDTMFATVASGKADAAVTNRFYGMMHAKQFGLQDTAVVFEPSDLFFAAPLRTDDELLDAIDRHLSDMKRETDSAYYQSLKKWTSEKVPFKLPAWIGIAGMVLGAATLVTLVGSIVLKRQVDARTRELQQINREMDQRIIARTAELAAAMEKAQAADRIKSAFLATMSHELRTPLNSIIGFTGIMLQGLAGELNPEQRKQMTMVQNSARHLLALINDVLDISKIEAGQLELAAETFDLGASLEKVVKLVAPLAERKGIDLRADFGDAAGPITCDQRRMEQVLLNLLGNAVKFTEQGHVHIGCRNEHDHYQITISDTGIGMRPQELPNLFQPFHQIDSGLARKREGTGLGLSICKKILDMMGGTISVQSRFGEGSTFTVRIPRQAGDGS